MNNDVNDIRPTSISHIVGQHGVIEQVRVALYAAEQDERRFDHALLVGSAGLGKTQIAAVIGQEMGTDYHELLGQSITSVADLNAVLLSAKDRDVILVTRRTNWRSHSRRRSIWPSTSGR
jgi:Holliday junction DNA helicase RuvB